MMSEQGHPGRRGTFPALAAIGLAIAWTLGPAASRPAAAQAKPKQVKIGIVTFLSGGAAGPAASSGFSGSSLTASCR